MLKLEKTLMYTVSVFLRIPAHIVSSAYDTANQVQKNVSHYPPSV